MSAPRISQSNAIAPPFPANLEAERAILGAVVLRNEALLEVLPVLRSEDFSLPQHRHIYKAMEELVASGKQML
jgi:replicative DNA helicase